VIAIGNLNINPRAGGLNIQSFEHGLSSRPGNGGDIYVYARTASGRLEIHNQGATPADRAGRVSLEFVSTEKSYQHIIVVDEHTSVQMVLNGYAVELQGPEHRLAGPILR
jgi:hypothetical protein